MHRDREIHKVQRGPACSNIGGESQEEKCMRGTCGDWDVLSFKCATESPRSLVKRQILDQWVRDRGGESQ